MRDRKATFGALIKINHSRLNLWADTRDNENTFKNGLKFDPLET